MTQIVCLSDQPWSAYADRTPQLMARLRDCQILYFEPPGPTPAGKMPGLARRVRPNILLYTLPSVPKTEDFYGLRLRLGRRKTADFIQARLQRHGFRDPLLWMTHPSYVPMLDYLAYRGLVYDCGAFHAPALNQQEGALAQAADVVFAASPGLKDRLSPCSANIAVIPNGVNHPMFCRADLTPPACLQGLPGPLLGWVGRLTPRLDLAPLEYTAAEHPGWTFVLAGDGDHPRLRLLRQLPNVVLPGPCPPEELPDWLTRFDACLHLLEEGSQDNDVIPSRFLEYLATGKPVVSMAWEDQVEYFPDVVYSAHSPQEFSQLCQRALEESPEWVSGRRREYGRASAWTNRAAEIKRILDGIGLF
ncbi:hypothetical protein SDC9_112498 [bioreactor metagenome]|uniref:Spore protein YkvP/CgeB glycosyl transferase-like domain-containing protein n=1 Tax=bioreactor metagenome TaxID=1076179 RepID=A0A645BM34_9ZZZZ